MKKFILSLLVFSLCLCGCTKTNEKQKKNVCDDSCTLADMSGYEEFTDTDHVFYEISMKEGNERLEDETFTGILYYGYIECPWCNEAVPVMNEVAKEMNLKIYYIDKHSDLNSSHPEWEEEAKEILGKSYELDKNDEGKVTLYVPEVVVVKDGKVLSHHMGTFDEHDAHERKMTNEEVEKLTSIYKEMFEAIKE